jgi:hypothetical protein
VVRLNNIGLNDNTVDAPAAKSHNVGKVLVGTAIARTPAIEVRGSNGHSNVDNPHDNKCTGHNAFIIVCRLSSDQGYDIEVD